MRLLTLVLCSACALETELNPKDTRPDVGADTAPETDTAETAAPTECPSETFAAAAVAKRDACALGAAVDYTPRLEWVNTEPGRAASAPLVAQLTDDDGSGVLDDRDLPDVVVVGLDGGVWAIAGDGTTLWSRPDLAAQVTTPALGDLDGDGFPEVVVAGYHDTVALHGEDGATLWTGPAVPEALVGGPAIADMEADGAPEVVIGATILDGSTGAIRGRGTAGLGAGFYMAEFGAIGVVADIDRDGLQEVVVGNALYDVNGDTIWTNGESDGFVAVGDFDGDPAGEIVVSYDGELRLQDDDGTVLWSGVSVGGSSGAPAIGDLDGDGEPEIAVPGGWAYYALGADGTIRWSTPNTDVTGAFAGSALFDFDGDGALEVVSADEHEVLVLDGRTGAVLLRQTDHGSDTYNEYATVADVDGDGHAEILYTSADRSGSPAGLRVLGDASNSWPPARTIWNQTAYAATQVKDDGTIPPVPSWEAGSTFRAQTLAAAGAAEPTDRADLYPHVYATCADECDDGRLLTAWIAVGNRGHADVTETVSVEVWGDTGAEPVLLHGLDWTAALPAGTLSEAREIELHVPRGIRSLTVVVDGGAAPRAGVADECDETNNAVTWTGALCP